MKICAKRDAKWHGIHKCTEPAGHEGQCVCGIEKNIQLQKCGLRFWGVQPGSQARKAKGAAA